MTRKLITILLSATLVAGFVVQSIASASPAATFDPSGMSIALSGTIGDKAGIVYTVTVASRQGDTPGFSKTNPPLGVSLFETGYGGEISESVRLSDNLEGGEYTAFFACNIDDEDKIFASHFSYTNSEEPATVELVNLLNGEDSGDKKGATNAAEFYDILSPRTNITKFGIVYDEVHNPETGTDKIPFISEVAYSMKKLQPNSEFTFDALCSVLFEAVAAYDMCTLGISAADDNKTYLGEQYSKLSDLTEDESARLDELLKTADYKGRSLKDIFTEKFIMSRLLCADTRLKIKAILSEYNKELGIDMSTGSDYDDVKDSRLYIIYDGIMDEISDDTRIDDIKDYFDKYVDKALDEPNESKKTSSGGGGGGGKSSVISGNNLTNPNTTVITPPTVPVPEAKPNTKPSIVFSDMDGHFAASSVQALAEKGIISGYPDGKYIPDGKVTRAEFCKIAANAFGIKSESIITFDDVGADAWYAKYVSALAANGIVMGYDGKFMPGSPITREDAAVIMHRIFAFKGITLADSKKEFEDTADISSYAKSPVSLLAGAGVINGNGGRFYPKNAISRGETAVLVYNAQNAVAGGAQ